MRIIPNLLCGALLALPPGPALAGKIVHSQARALAALEQAGHYLAKFKALTVEAEKTTVSSWTGVPGKRTLRSFQWFRSAADGRNAFMTTWFPVAGTADPLKLGGATTDEFVWTGADDVFTARRRGRIFEATVDGHPDDCWQAFARAAAGAVAMGIMYGDFRPFPLVLRGKGMAVRASGRSVRIGGFRCMHLNAVGPHGTYSLWVAPHRGWVVMRAVVQKKSGNDFFGKLVGRKAPKLPKGAPAIALRVESDVRVVLSHVVIGQVGGFWFPRRFEIREQVQYTDGPTFSSVGHVQVPRFSPTCSPTSPQFRPDIPNGTRVWDMDHPTIQHIWHNGKVVPAYDKAGIRKLNRDIGDLRREGAAYFTAPIAARVTPTPTVGVPRTVAAGKAVVGDAVAASTSLWGWCIAATSATEAGVTPSGTAILRSCAKNLAKLDDARVVATDRDGDSFRGKSFGYEFSTQSYFRSGGKIALTVTDVPISSLVHGVQIGGKLRDQFIWAGGIHYFTGWRGGRLTASFTRKAMKRWGVIAGAGFALAPVLGILYGDTHPFPTVLGRAGTVIRVAKKMQSVGKYRCLRLLASGPAGKYSIWVAPACGYAVVKAIVSKGPKDTFMGRGLLGRKPHYPKGWPGPVRKPTASFNMVFDHVRVKQSHGFWYPARFRLSYITRSVTGAVYHDTVRAEIRRLSFSCPSTDKAFTPNIPDGAVIHDMDDPAIQYIWHNGKVLPGV